MNDSFITTTVNTFERRRESPNTGRLVSLFSQVYVNSVELVLNIREYIAPAIVSAMLGIIVFFVYNRKVGAVFTGGIVAFAITYALVLLMLRKPGLQVEQCRLDHDDETTDMIMNIHNVYAVNMTKRHLESFRSTLKHCGLAENKLFNTVAGGRSLLMIMLSLAFVCPLLMLIHVHRCGDLSMTSVAGCVFALAFIREYLFGTVNHLYNLSWYSSYLHQADIEVKQLLATETEQINNLQKDPPLDTTIKVSDVLVADRIPLPDMLINPGERIVIRGPIGSGKSTLLNVLFGKMPYMGSVTIGGVEVRDLDVQTLRDMMLLVSQTVSLFDNTVYYNIAYGNDSSRDTVQELLDRYNITFAKLDDKVGRLGESFSGGQRQLIFLLRALLRKEKIRIVLMDEPTSALDPKTREVALRIIAELIESRSAILVTHDETLEALATQVLHLKPLN